MSLFILGIERSATTWASNILEAHPDTEVFMEPMSIYKTRFKEWPNRFEKIADANKMSRYFWEEMNILRNRKRWALTRLTEKSIAWNLDLTLAEFLVQKKMANDHVTDFYELNFHKKNSFGWYPKSENRVDVIKSLRLNFNADLIREIDPQAKVIVVIRDLASTILSIHSQLKRGKLSELRALMETKFGDTGLHSLCHYWQFSYNSLLSGLDDSETPYLVLKHPYMLKNLKKTVGKLMDFSGLEKSDSVYHYLEESNRAGIGLHSTDRDHASLLRQTKKAQNGLPNELKDKIKRADFHPVLKDLADYG